MRYQDQVVQMTQRAHESFLKSVRAVPNDKLDWRPLDSGRSALDQLQEVAQAPTYAIPMLVERKVGPWDPVAFEQIKAARQGWSVADCERVLADNSKRFFEVVQDFPDADLQATLFLPFAGGFESSYAEIMLYPYWNAVYHLGQVNYIQTLYGDWEMR